MPRGGDKSSRRKRRKGAERSFESAIEDEIDSTSDSEFEDARRLSSSTPRPSVTPATDAFTSKLNERLENLNKEIDKDLELITDPNMKLFLQVQAKTTVSRFCPIVSDLQNAFRADIQGIAARQELTEQKTESLQKDHGVMQRKVHEVEKKQDQDSKRIDRLERAFRTRPPEKKEEPMPTNPIEQAKAHFGKLLAEAETTKHTLVIGQLVGDRRPKQGAINFTKKDIEDFLDDICEDIPFVLMKNGRSFKVSPRSYSDGEILSQLLLSYRAEFRAMGLWIDAVAPQQLNEAKSRAMKFIFQVKKAKSAQLPSLFVEVKQATMFYKGMPVLPCYLLPVEEKTWPDLFDLFADRIVKLADSIWHGDDEKDEDGFGVDFLKNWANQCRLSMGKIKANQGQTQGAGADKPGNTKESEEEKAKTSNSTTDTIRGSPITEEKDETMIEDSEAGELQDKDSEAKDSTKEEKARERAASSSTQPQAGRVGDVAK